MPLMSIPTSAPSEHEARIAKLSPRQRQCLRGVAELRQSEEIAAELGIRKGTVDNYIAQAVSTLDVINRRQAAKLLLEWEKATMDSAGVDSTGVVPGPPDPPSSDPTERESRESDGVEDGCSPSYDATPLHSRESFRRIAGDDHNDLNISRRLLYILLGALAIMVAVVAAVNIAETLLRIGLSGRS